MTHCRRQRVVREVVRISRFHSRKILPSARWSIDEDICCPRCLTEPELSQEAMLQWSCEARSLDRQEKLPKKSASVSGGRIASYCDLASHMTKKTLERVEVNVKMTLLIRFLNIRLFSIDGSSLFLKFRKWLSQDGYLNQTWKGNVQEIQFPLQVKVERTLGYRDFEILRFG